MENNYYPLSGFYFNVKFTPSINDTVSGFKEVSGLEVKIETQKVIQGGDHKVFHLPNGHPQYKNLVLKRGFFASSGFSKWCKATFEEFKIEVKNLDIELLAMEKSSKVIKASWHIVNAYPISWSISPFDAQKNEVAIETVELAYSHFFKTK